ncbi:MAG: hypothetical protein ABSB88_00595 [Bryobacteraceae bacterium]|jgi:hypothetical protein
MSDYTWPSIFFAYGFFGICLAVAIFFFVRSMKDGYWGKSGEEIKYRVFDEDAPAPRSSHGTK